MPRPDLQRFRAALLPELLDYCHDIGKPCFPVKVWGFLATCDLQTLKYINVEMAVARSARKLRKCRFASQQLPFVPSDMTLFKAASVATN